MSAQAGDRLARLLALVPWLVAHDGITISACAQHFGVSAEQLERDLWLLVVCGVPGYGPDQLVDIDFWDDGVIHVIDPQTLDRPLRITEEEALTLLVALRMLAQLPGIEDRAAILSAAAKLEEHASGAERYVAVEVGVAAEVTDAVDRALADGGHLSITYAAATRDEVSTRTVRPIRVIAVDGVGYLEAYCLTAEAVRTFRLDRIVAAEVAEAVTDADAIDTGAPGLREPAEEAVLRLAPAARWIVDVHEGVTVVGEEGTDLIVRMPLHTTDWAVRLILSLRGAGSALEPPALVQAVASAARSAAASYA